MIHYIYKIVNLINNKLYVGYTARHNPIGRWKQHIRDAKKVEFQHRPLYRALNKYGVENFKFEIIYCSKDAAHTLSIMENYFILYNQTHITSDGYNLTFGGESNFGWVPSKETRRLWSSQRKGRKLTEEHKTALSEKMKKRYQENPQLREYYRQLAIKQNKRPPDPTTESRKKAAKTRTGKPHHTEKRKQQLRQMAQKGELKFNTEDAKNKRKQTWKQKKRNIGPKNGRAVFCEIFNCDGNLVGSGFLQDECDRLNAPFDKFLAASRHERPLQRGKWKGWRIIRIQKVNNILK